MRLFGNGYQIWNRNDSSFFFTSESGGLYEKYAITNDVIKYAITNDVSKYAITNDVIKYAITNDVIKYVITNDVIK